MFMVVTYRLWCKKSHGFSEHYGKNKMKITFNKTYPYQNQFSTSARLMDRPFDLKTIQRGRQPISWLPILRDLCHRLFVNENNIDPAFVKVMVPTIRGIREDGWWCTGACPELWSDYYRVFCLINFFTSRGYPTKRALSAMRKHGG